MLVTSNQDEEGIFSKLEVHRVPQIRVQATKIAGDVKLTIKNQIRLAGLGVKMGSQWQEKLENYLLENTQHTFLWAVFIIKNINEHVQGLAPDDLDFDRIVANIPSDLEDVYHSMMLKIYRRALQGTYYSLDVNPAG